LVNHVPHEFEPPHPVCDMKSEKRREGVVGKREGETPEIHDVTEKRTQRQQYRDELCFRETFT